MTFVGRTTQMQQVRAALAATASPGPVIITGVPGAGRTSLLHQVLSDAGDDNVVVRLESGCGHAPFSSVARHLPDGFDITGPLAATVWEAANTIGFAARAHGRKLVVALDDAHLADHTSMLVLRELHQRFGATLLLTAPEGELTTPDPLDTVRFEPGTRTVHLPPLTCEEVGALLGEDGPVSDTTVQAVHAASAGSPARLHDLLVHRNLMAHSVVRDGVRTLGTLPESPAGAADPVLEEAISQSWLALRLDRTEQLCAIAAWTGTHTEEISRVRAMTLLLRDRGREALAALSGVRDAEFVRALVLAFGLRMPADASDLLRSAAQRDLARRPRLLAQRRWLLTMSGRPADTGGDQQDAVAAMFDHLAQASRSAPAPAVAHLRRALVAAEHRRAEFGWLVPYLRANLIDALVLAGRTHEATTAAAGFHAANACCGWDIAVAVSNLLGDKTRTRVALAS